MVESHWSTHPKIPWRKNHPLDRDSRLSSRDTRGDTRYSIRRVSSVSIAVDRVLPSRLREEAVVRDSAKWVTRMVARRRYDWLSLLTQRTRPGVVASKQPAGVSVVGQPVCQRWTWSDSRLFPCYDRFDRGATPLFRRGGMKRGWIIFIWYIHVIYIYVSWWQCFFFSFFLCSCVNLNFIKDNDPFWARRKFSEVRKDKL